MGTMQLLALVGALSLTVEPTRLPRVLDAKQACFPFGLPKEFYSSPQESSGSARHGLWETHDGAALASWEQTEYGEETAMELTVMGRVMARFETKAKDPDQKADHIDRDIAVSTAENCDGTTLFELHELPGADAPVELYGYDGAILARGHVSKLDPLVFVWEDASNASLAMATDELTCQGCDLNVFGGMLHFKMQYTDTAVNTSSAYFLMDPYNRWVLASATQLRELREADRRSGLGSIRDGNSGHWKIFVLVCKVLTGITLLVGVFAALYSSIYPLRRNVQVSLRPYAPADILHQYPPGTVGKVDYADWHAAGHEEPVPVCLNGDPPVSVPKYALQKMSPAVQRVKAWVGNFMGNPEKNRLLQDDPCIDIIGEKKRHMRGQAPGPGAGGRGVPPGTVPAQFPSYGTESMYVPTPLARPATDRGLF